MGSTNEPALNRSRFFQVPLAAGSNSYTARSACLNGQEKAQEVMCAEAKG